MRTKLVTALLLLVVSGVFSQSGRGASPSGESLDTMSKIVSWIGSFGQAIDNITEKEKLKKLDRLFGDVEFYIDAIYGVKVEIATFDSESYGEVYAQIDKIRSLLTLLKVDLKTVQSLTNQSGVLDIENEMETVANNVLGNQWTSARDMAAAFRANLDRTKLLGKVNESLAITKSSKQALESIRRKIRVKLEA